MCPNAAIPESEHSGPLRLQADTFLPFAELGSGKKNARIRSVTP
jgi:hypothetical protein